MSDLYEFFKSMTIFTNPVWKSWLLLTKLGACITISRRSVSTKALTFWIQGKQVPEMSLRINTVCNFQTMESAVKLNRLLLKFLILCHVDIQKISLEDNQKQPPEVFCKISCSSNFTGRQLCWSLFLIKLEGWGLHFYQKEIPTQLLSCKICEICKNTYFEGHLCTTASG